MASLISLRRRIKSIKNTRQITQAMEKVSAVKMKRAQTAAIKSRRYQSLAWEIVTALQKNAQKDLHLFFRERDKVASVGLVVLSSTRGLCGSLNMKLLQSALQEIKTTGLSKEHIVIYAAGKKVRDSLARMGFKVAADFGSVPANPTSADVMPLTKVVIEDYEKGTIDRVILINSYCRDTMSQIPVARTLLPIEKPERERQEKPASFEYVFEPSAEEVLDGMVRRIIELQLYAAMLEHNASEHSSRMVAMKNATDNIKELIGDLTLAFNATRQAVITREIAEISAGKAALEI